MKKYKVELTESQLSTLSVAAEILARLGIGQFRDAIDHLPLRSDINYSDYHADVDAIGKILSKHLKNKVDGYRSSLGIHNEEVSNTSRIAWDLYQVFRHELAWDRAVDEGWVESKDGPRDWDKMMAVSYDAPHVTSAEPLAVIEQ